MFNEPQFDRAQALVNRLEQDLGRATARAIQAEVQVQYYEEILKANAEVLGLQLDPVTNMLMPKQDISADLPETEHVIAVPAQPAEKAADAPPTVEEPTP